MRRIPIIFVLLLVCGSVPAVMANESYEFVTAWGTGGSDDGEFNLPLGIAADGGGSVFVTEYNNHRVQKFDANGTFLAKWGEHGSGDGQFNVPVRDRRRPLWQRLRDRFLQLPCPEVRHRGYVPGEVGDPGVQ